MYMCQICFCTLDIVQLLKHNCTKRKITNYEPQVNKIIKHKSFVKSEDMLKSECLYDNKNHKLIYCKFCLLKIVSYRFDRHQYSCKKLLDYLENKLY